MSEATALEQGRSKLFWCAALAALILAVLIFLMRGTAADIVTTWYASNAFNHGFLIIPICLYLIWRERANIAASDVVPDFRGILVVTFACLAWLVGYVTATLVIQEFSLVIIAQGVILTMFGWNMCRALAFPLGYLYFAVPAGQALIPSLQAVTASIAVGMLRAVGLAVYVDGNVISVPTGTFYVAEACSGISFLIASMALGTLFAGLIFRSWWRRALFLGIALTVPILANGMRAFGIIFLAYLTSNELALGVDHIIYGWIFFTLITFLTLALGMSFRDEDTFRLTPAPIQPHEASSINRPLSLQRMSLAGLVALVPVMLTVLYSARIVQSPVLQAIQLQSPEVSAPWHHVEGLPDSARPEFAAADAEIHLAYEAGPSRAYLHIGYYQYNRRNAQAVSSVHDFGGGGNWVTVDTGLTTARIEDRAITVRVSRSVLGRQGYLTWYWYWIDGRFTANPYLAKLLEAKTKLMGGNQAAAVIAVSTFYDDDPTKAVETLRQFTPAIQSLSMALDQTSAR